MAARPTTCTVCHKNLSTRNRVTDILDTVTGDYDDMCVKCYEADPKDTDELINTPAPTGRKNINHADCGHPRTPKGRAECRAARAAGTPVHQGIGIVSAKGSKVVHQLVGDDMTYSCTRKAVKDDATTSLGQASDVTCKNCLKVA